MPTREFAVCVRGLSDQSLFLKAVDAEPTTADRPEDIAGIFGSYLGGPATTE